MDRALAKEFMHLRDWLSLAAVIVANGKAEYLSDPISQEAGDSIMMKIGELAGRMSRKGIKSPDSVRWSDAVANRNWVIHQYDEIDREITWNTLDKSVMEWRNLFALEFDIALSVMNEESN